MLQKYEEFMQRFIAFKSISTDAQFKSDCSATAEFLKNEFTSKGFTAETIEGYGNPLVLAEVTIDPSLKTVLIYGHYDVQPAEISEGWDADPFSLFEKEGRFIARGIVDNKGQIAAHIVTVFDLIDKNALKYNVKFLIEGDEESGSGDIEEFFKKYTDKLKTDLVLISDGELMMGHPIIDIGYRGIFNCTLIVTTSLKDNHSGAYGGSIPNAANELAQLLAKMHNENGRLSISGIDNDYQIDPSIVENNKRIPFTIENLKEVTGSKKFLGDNVVDFYTLTGYMTSAEITGLNSGYIKEGYKNAIPGTAFAKINFRLAGNTSVAKAVQDFKQFVETNKPEYVDYELLVEHSSEPIVLDYKNAYVEEALKVQKEIYGVDTILLYNGAIIPIAGYFKEYLHAAVVSAGIGNEDCNMHGVNENFKISDLEKGLEFSRRMLSK